MSENVWKVVLVTARWKICLTHGYCLPIGIFAQPRSLRAFVAGRRLLTVKNSHALTYTFMLKLRKLSSLLDPPKLRYSLWRLKRDSSSLKQCLQIVDKYVLFWELKKVYAYRIVCITSQTNVPKTALKSLHSTVEYEKKLLSNFSILTTFLFPTLSFVFRKLRKENQKNLQMNLWIFFWCFPTLKLLSQI